MDNPQQIIETTETIITDMVGHYSWMFIAAFAVLLFKNVVTNILDGLLFMFGHDFDVDDIVYKRYPTRKDYTTNPHQNCVSHD